MKLDPTFVQLVIAAIGGGAVSEVRNFLSDKSKSRAYTMGAVDKAVQQAMAAQSSTIERLEHEIGRQSEEIKELRLDHQECRDSLAANQAAHVELRQQIEDLVGVKNARSA